MHTNFHLLAEAIKILELRRTFLIEISINTDIYMIDQETVMNKKSLEGKNLPLKSLTEKSVNR